MKHFVAPAAALAGTLAAAFLLAPAEANACGGTFCDGGPQPMPVDQSGENILFVRDGDVMEAHIQIQYMGNPERFGWVIPMQSAPEFSVGSEPLFQALLAGSVPSYFTQATADDCNFGDGDDGDSPPNGGGDGAGGDSGGDDGGEGGLMTVTETVGAFEITVLSGGTAEEVNTWLVDNEYETDDAALPILAEYLDEGHVFGAVKLTSGAGVNEIHPIVLRFESDEPCIPLRLTRIAATDDMDVRTFFLGDDRVVPKNYRHVLVNPLKIDWLNSATNYKEVISLAVDAPGADGRAFVTEYAGPSNAVSQVGLVNDALDPDAFLDADVVDVIDILEEQGAYVCDFDFGTGCGGTHPLMQPIVSEFIPVPDGVEADDFYDCLECYVDDIDQAAWDATAFGAAIRSRIIMPGMHAQQLLDQNDYLTRMYTTISPHEMMTDPMFHENPDLDEVVAAQVGSQRFLCNNDSVYTLPDGREVYLPAGATWPTFEDEEAWVQPSTEEVQEVMTSGAPLLLSTNTEAIDVALAAYNAAMGWPGGGEDGGGEGGEGGEGGADGGTGGSGGDGGAGVDSDDGGCGCRTTNAPLGMAWTLLFGLGLVNARRRRD